MAETFANVAGEVEVVVFTSEGRHFQQFFLCLLLHFTRTGCRLGLQIMTHQSPTSLLMDHAMALWEEVGAVDQSKTNIQQFAEDFKGRLSRNGLTVATCLCHAEPEKKRLEEQDKNVEDYWVSLQGTWEGPPMVSELQFKHKLHHQFLHFLIAQLRKGLSFDASEDEGVVVEKRLQMAQQAFIDIGIINGGQKHVTIGLQVAVAFPREDPHVLAAQSSEQLALKGLCEGGVDGRKLPLGRKRAEGDGINFDVVQFQSFEAVQREAFAHYYYISRTGTQNIHPNHFSQTKMFHISIISLSRKSYSKRFL